MNRIRQWVNQLSVKKKLIFYGYLIISPVLLCICGALLLINYQRNSRNILERDLNDVKTLAESIYLLQTEIKDYSTYICINEEVQRLLTAKNIELLNRNSRLWLDSAPMEIVQDMIGIKGYIKTLAIYPENGVRPYLRCLDSSAYYQDIESIRQKDFYLVTRKIDNGILWRSVTKDDKDTYQTNRSDKLVLYRGVYDLAKKNLLGFIIIGADMEPVQNTCDNFVRSDNEGVMIFDRYGGVLCRSGNIPEEIAQYLSNDDFLQQKYGQRKSYFTYAGYTIICEQRGNNESIICKIVPPYSQQINFMDVAYIPISLFFGILFGLLPLLLIISNIVTKPLQQVNSAMVKFSAGDFSQKVDIRSQDEIGEVAKCFNNMVEDIKVLIEENYVITLKERESELIALQAQINPHFLYNTLDTLYWQATEYGNEEVAESIFALSQLFRLVLSQGKSEVTVQEEMNLVATYLQIQKSRFSKRLHYHIEVDDAVKDCRIPKLILQPFVENAIVHGFENVGTQCQVTVSAVPDGRYIRFMVQDTGIGMSEQQVREIFEKDSEQYASQRVGRYAIKNIQERLKLKYHEDFTLEIQSSIGKGTTVIMCIPIER